MKNKTKTLIEELGFNYQKERNKIIFGALLIIVLSVGLFFFFVKNILMIPAGLLIAMVYVWLSISRFSSIKAKREKEHFDEFVTVISYFQTFIENHHNVYQSFVKILPYSSPWIHSAIEKMLGEIDTDKSVNPFIHFAEQFNEKIVHNIMLSIYQMVDRGEDNGSLNQFTVLFTQIYQNRYLSVRSKKEKSFDIVNVFPMVGAALITIVLSLSLISVMGDLVNVI